jgi:hypothetical protein
LQTPVAFLIFNRPETTKRVFEEIRKAQPSKLYVIADGPRIDRPGEDLKCQLSREIIEQIDWPCELLQNYSDINLGCKIRVSSGINWVFEHEEEAIFLEDDCLPHPTFFPYCELLLKKFRYNERIGMISGSNYLPKKLHNEASYYYSVYPHIWGWASWRRAWKHYDVYLSLWPEIKDTNFLEKLLGKNLALIYWNNIFQSVYECRIDTWDYQWVFACWKNNFLSVTPTQNMISNIGFGNDATHKQIIRFANMKIEEMTFPLTHIEDVLRDYKADRYIEKHNFSGTASWKHLLIIFLKDVILRNRFTS